MMKTVTQVFVTGVKEITTTPALFGDVLKYEGKLYKVGTVRQEVQDLFQNYTATTILDCINAFIPLLSTEYEFND